MLKELKTFQAVARFGTLSRAAERLGLTQSAVSAQIQRLEAALGFPVFDRQGRNVVLNAAGGHTLARAAALIEQFEALRQPGAAQAAVTLRIGAIASIQAAGLPEAVMRLRGAYPTLRLKVVPGVSLALMGRVDAGELDAAVMIRPNFALPRDLAWRPLWTEPFLLAVPAGETSRDWRRLLRERPFLRYDRASFGGRVVAQFLEDEGIDVQDVVEMDEIAGLVRMVALGLGVALVPRCPPYVPLPEGARALSLGSVAPRREIGIVERVRHGQTPLVKTFAEALRESRRPGAGRRQAVE